MELNFARSSDAVQNHPIEKHTANSNSALSSYRSLQRGLEILRLIQERGRIKIGQIGTDLGMPVSTVYRYTSILRESGFAVEVDGYLVASSRLSESDEAAPHLVRYAAPVLRRMREQTGMTGILAVRVHITAMCLEVSYAHPQHRISFGRGQIRSLYSGATALPLLAHAPQKIVKELLSGDLRSYTAATISPGSIEAELRQVRLQGYAVSCGQVTPGMVAVGVPLLVRDRCLSSLSLVGEEERLTMPVEGVVRILRQGAAELALQLPANAEKEVWSGPNE